MIAQILLGLLIVAQMPGGMGGLGPGFGGPPAIYSIEGYLDAAPQGEPVLREAQLGAGDRRRTLLITSYRRIGGGDREQLVRDVGHLEADFMLKGPAADVERIFRAPAGSRVRGTFKHMRGGRQSLLIIPAELTIESPQKAGAG